MATTFVNSGAAGVNNGTSWTDAWTSLASSNGAAAGDVVKVHKAHSQSGLVANINWSNGTPISPVKILCVDKDAADALSTGASVAWNSSGTGPQGSVFVYGMTLTQATGQFALTSSTGGSQEYESCTITITSNSNIQPGTGSRSLTIFRNTNFDLSGASGTAVIINFGGGNECDILWIAGTVTCKTSQVSLFSPPGGLSARVRFYGVNFSGTVTNLFSTATSSSGYYGFFGCSAPTYTNVITGGPPTNKVFRLNMDGLLGGTLTTALLPPTNQQDLQGTVKSTTARYRTGGANDGSQANAYSWEMAGNTSTAVIVSALASPPISRWAGTGSQVLKVYVAGGTTLNNDEFWIEVLSPSEAGSATAQAKFQSTRLAPLGTPAALTTDGGSTWNGSGVGTIQYATVTINPTVPGVVEVRCYLAKNVTVYVDPVIEVAGDVAGKSRFVEGVQTFAATGGGAGGKGCIIGG